MDCGLRTADCRLRTANCELRIADWPTDHSPCFVPTGRETDLLVFTCFAIRIHMCLPLLEVGQFHVFLTCSSGTKYCPEIFALPTNARTHSLFHDNTHSNQPLADTYTHCVPIFKKTVTLIILILSFSCCISNLPFPVSTNLRSDSYEDMIDHHSYACNLSSCEIKAWIKFRPIPVQCSTN